MLMFLILAMVTAYTSRNLVFEQRTGVNQVRSTQAIEVAQAGLDWALAQLNGGRITASCTASTDPSHDTFRQRYLNTDVSTGALTARVIAGAPVQSLTPSCVLVAGNWTCSCPSTGAPTLATPIASTVSPAFRVRFVNETNPVLSMIRIEVNGCTRLDSTCLDFPSRGAEAEGRATLYALVSMKSALTTPPAAALTARGAPTGDVRLVNTDAAIGGITVASGTATTGIDDAKLQSTPGTPAVRSRIDNDASLSDSNLPGTPFTLGQRMFASVFGMWPKTYREQPAALVMNCGLNPCMGSALRTLANNHPGRPIIVAGDLDIDDSVDIGSATTPVVIVVEGSGGLTFSASGRIYGLVYGSRSDALPGSTWTLTGPGEIRGALVSEHGITASGDATVVYDRDVLTRIRLTYGSFVIVPGSWRDFQ